MILRSRNINFLRQTVYELMPGGLQIRQRDMHGYRATTVDYDQIGADATPYEYGSALARTCVIAFSAVGVVAEAAYLIWDFADQYASLVWFGLALISYVCFRVTKRSGVHLESGSGYVMINGDPDEVGPFMDALVARKMLRIRSKASDLLLVSGECTKVWQYLFILKESRVLTAEQLDLLKGDLAAEADRAGIPDRV